ncbi:MAG: DNA-processing protein DprA [Ruminococcus flavefaciens]|nr:DNA-processing protein DprA [Ruminococcus flavefaciens]
MQRENRAQEGGYREKMKRVYREDPDYPGRLREIPDSPKILYYEGRLPEEDRVSVAIIGARECSEYGRYVAAGLGALMGKNGVQVISGMARGIDGIAQAAALEAGGSSFAVLGSGVDVCYPAQNRELYERLKQSGGILSEYPPGTPARAGNFPPRNRIVSGLADAVVVVEAREKSGTLITVDMALEQGKEVFAVPGRLTDGLSAGCNRLLKMGAGILAGEEEFLEELRGIAERRRALFGDCGGRAADNVFRPERIGLEDEGLQAVYDILDFEPKSVEQIRAGLQDYGEKEIVMLLIRLCMEKLAVQVSPGRFALRTG